MNNKVDFKTIRKGVLPYVFLLVIMLGIVFVYRVADNKNYELKYN